MVFRDGGAALFNQLTGSHYDIAFSITASSDVLTLEANGLIDHVDFLSGDFAGDAGYSRVPASLEYPILFLMNGVSHEMNLILVLTGHLFSANDSCDDDEDGDFWDIDCDDSDPK